MEKGKPGAHLETFASSLLRSPGFYPFAFRFYFMRTEASRRIITAPRISAVPKPSSGNPSDAAF